MGLLNSSIFSGKSVYGFMSYDRASKQLYILYTPNINKFQCTSYSLNNSSLYIRDNHKINHQFISIVLIKDSSFVGNSIFLMLINNKFEQFSYSVKQVTLNFRLTVVFLFHGSHCNQI